MDKFLAYAIVFALGAFIIIGGNYFLTDDVGNFSMEKAKNLIPNIEVALLEKRDEITGTRDINKDMNREKDAERLSAEGPNEIVIDNNPETLLPDDSVFKEYLEDWNVIESNRTWTDMQRDVELDKFIDKYSSKRHNWKGIISNVIEYSNGITVFLYYDDDSFHQALFCKLQNRLTAMSLEKGQVITVRGDFEFSMRSPWLKNCEIVSVTLPLVGQ